MNPSAGLSRARPRLKSLRNLGVGFCELLLLHGQHRTKFNTSRDISATDVLVFLYMNYVVSFACSKMRSSIFVSSDSM